jgi:deoxyribonuclease IV
MSLIEKLRFVGPHKKTYIYDTKFSGYDKYIQVFLSDPSSVSTLPPFDEQAYSRVLQEKGDTQIFVHGSYAYNLSGSAKEVSQGKENALIAFMIRHLVAEMDLCVILDTGPIIHFSSSFRGKEYARERMINSIDIAFGRKSVYTSRVASFLNVTEEEVLERRQLILENSSGEKNKIGNSMREIALICDLFPNVYACFDTCHTFASGEINLSLREEINRMLFDLDFYLKRKIRIIHLNDAEYPFGSRKDRHERLGHGFIFKGREENLIFLIGELVKRGLPMINE